MIVRNCKATEISRSASTVYFKLHFSDMHVWSMPVKEWDTFNVKEED
ncbi:hypothetical protein [Stenotrophomonas phage StenR_269]|nr:hypothetical protein [Stenotrophomonas phage StenR_269]